MSILPDETQRQEPEKLHCVTQLREDSWEYRLKRPEDEPNDDDLVSWEYHLQVHDRLVIERNELEKRRVRQIERLHAELSALRAEVAFMSRQREAIIDASARVALQLRAERDEANARVEKLRSVLELANKLAERFRAERDTERQRAEIAEQRLRIYGQHLPPCRFGLFGLPCNCGLAALQPIPKGEP